MKTVAALRRLCDPYANVAGSDCVELSHILHYVLEAQGIAHSLCMGDDWNSPAIRNNITKVEFTHHMWLEVDTTEGKAIIDYHARAWLGSKGLTPHGVFLKSAYSHMRYSGHTIQPIFPEWAVLWVVDPEHYSPPGDEAMNALKAEVAKGPMKQWYTSSEGRTVPTKFQVQMVKKLQNTRIASTSKR